MPINFTIGGHVDAGKSTVCGHLEVLAGQVSDHELNKLKDLAIANKQTGAEYAFILDCDEYEREKNITTEASSREFTYQNSHYRLVDGPGHRMYVRSLIEGLNQYPPKSTIGCLIISLASSEFESGWEGGQTRENAKLLRGVGMDHLVILMNKIDLVGPETPRYAEILNKVQKYVQKLGFKTIHVHAISGYRGDGLPEFLNLLKRIHQEHIIPETGSLVSETRSSVSESNSTIMSKDRTFPMIQVAIMVDEDFDKMISAGFTCILHSCKREYQVTIEKFRHFDPKTKKIVQKSVIAKNGEVIVARLSCDQEFYFEDLEISEKVILRKDDFTIAFGKIYHPKTA